MTRPDDDAAYGEIRMFSPAGRLGRVRYIGYTAWLSLAVMLLAIVVSAFAAAVDPLAGIGVVAIGYVAVIVIQFILTIQRAHDMNVSGWLSLILLIPLAFLVFWLVPGTRGENDYGKPPPPNSAGVVLACLLPVLTAFVGILAAIAIPAYQDYTIRAQVSEGLIVVAAEKAAVEESFARTGSAPADRLAAGLSAAATDTAGQYVASVDVDRGTIFITYGDNANSMIAGRVLALQPYVAGDGSVVWRCGQAAAPAGVVAMEASAIASAAVTDIEPRFLPSACRP